MFYDYTYMSHMKEKEREVSCKYSLEVKSYFADVVT